MSLISELRSQKPKGKQLTYSLSRYVSLCGTRSRLKKEPGLENAHWSFLVDKENKKVYVNRTK